MTDPSHPRLEEIIKKTNLLMKGRSPAIGVPSVTLMIVLVSVSVTLSFTMFLLRCMYV
jgi:hypothetical protein